MSIVSHCYQLAYLHRGTAVTMYLGNFGKRKSRLERRLWAFRKAGRSATVEGCRLDEADPCASSFHEHGVAPEAVEFGNVFTASDLAEAAGVAHAKAGLVLREDAALERPDAVRFRQADHFTQQG